MTSLDYPGPVERVYRRLRGHPWLADGALVVVLLGGSATAFVGQPGVLLVTVALVAAVAVRRRFPVAGFAVALAIGIAQVAVGIGQAFTDSALQPTFADAGILVLVYTVAADRPRRVSLAGLGACMALFVAAVARWNPGSAVTGRPLDFAIVFMTYALMPVCAWVLGEAMARRRAYLAALEERAVRAEAERDTQAQIATAAERARIARELHDVIAHNLSVMVAQADGGRYAFDAAPERSRQALAEIGDTGRQALSEMSHLLGVLRAGDDATEFAPAPGVDEIADLIVQAREAGTRVSYLVEGGGQGMPAGISLTVYRIVQEALTNVRKHGGPGAAAEVTLRYASQEVSIRVTDDGGGAPSPVRNNAVAGHGLAGMRERAGLYDGTVAAGPRPGGGFEVFARLPLPAAVAMTGDAA